MKQSQGNEEDEEEWPTLPLLIKSSQTPFILVTPSSQNKAEDEEEKLTPSLGSFSSSSTVGVPPSSDYLPVLQSVDGPEELSGHLPSFEDGLSPNTHQTLSEDGPPPANTHQPLFVDGPEEEVRPLLHWDWDGKGVLGVLWQFKHVVKS